MNNTIKGIQIAILSNLLFGVLYLYSDWMKPIDGTAVFAWRMVSMAICLWLMLILSGNMRLFIQFMRRLGKSTPKWLGLLLPAPILASQLWLFMWAPVNGYGVDVAMGYFLFPLMMALFGWLFLGEKLNLMQWAALAVVAVGVLYEVWQTGSFSWATVWVFSTYPFYYLPRKHQKIPALMGLLFDLTLIAPCCLFYLVISGDIQALVSLPKLWLLVPMLGLISALALRFNLHAGQLLPVIIFSMLSYLEPLFLFLLAVFVLHETISATALFTYSLIWCGLMMTLLDSGWRIYRARSS